MQRVEKFLWSFFLIMGLIFFVIGFILFKNVFPRKNMEKIEGTITQITENTTTFFYTVAGRNYETTLNLYVSWYRVGDKITIYYDKINPNQIRVRSFDFFFFPFLGIGLLLIVIGGIGLFYPKYKQRKGMDLKSNGILIQATYVDTVINSRYAVNGVNPYKIVVKGQVEGQDLEFESENLWFDPASRIKKGNITTFPVYIDPKNKKKYVVDVSSVTDYITRKV